MGFDWFFDSKGVKDGLKKPIAGVIVILLNENWKIMDDKNQRGGADRKRIDVNEEYELRDWSEKFNVSREELKKAVDAVGTFADDVEKYLKKG